MSKPVTNNSDLKNFYDAAYKKGEDEIFTYFVNGKHTSEDHPAVLESISWENKRVLDVGCGTGMLVREIAKRGARYAVGIDYSEEAITQAKEKCSDRNVEFKVGDFMTYQPEEIFDVVITLGTLEHLDNPKAALKSMKNLTRKNGLLIVACPHFINIRGFVWMALATLLKVPVSLSDLHFIHPWDIQEWAKEINLTAHLVKTVDQEWANGERLLRDFDKRLRNALRDANFPTDQVDPYLKYLNNLTGHLRESGDSYRLDGATAIYHLKKKE